MEENYEPNIENTMPYYPHTRPDGDTYRCKYNKSRQPTHNTVGTYVGITAEIPTKNED